LLIVAVVGPPLLAVAYYLIRGVQSAHISFEILLLALLLTGVVLVAAIFDYRRRPTPSHLVIAIYALLVFAFVVAILCLL